MKLLLVAVLVATALATDCIPQVCRCKDGAVSVSTKDADGCDTCYCATGASIAATTTASTAAPTTTKASTAAPATTKAATTAAATTKAATTTAVAGSVNLCPAIPALITCNCKADALPYYATNTNGCLYCGCKAIATTTARTTAAAATTARATTAAATTAAPATTKAAATTAAAATTKAATTTAAANCETPTPCYCNPAKAQLVWQADSEGCPYCFCQAAGSALGVTPATAPDSGNGGVPTVIPVVAAVMGVCVVVAAIAAVFRYRAVNGHLPWAKATEDTSVTSAV